MTSTASTSPDRHSQFASWYDLATLSDWFYHPARAQAIDQLWLSGGDTVFDIFCGTGVNIDPLSRRLGPRGQIIGVDGSAAMLQRAQSKVVQMPSPVAQVELMQADFTMPADVECVVEAIHSSEASAFLFTLGLTCLPNWRGFFRTVFDAASQGARFAIMDVYNDHSTLGTRLMDWIGAGDTQRPVWAVLEQQSRDFFFDIHPFRVLHAVLDVFVVVAAGSKR